ncbi:bifunctional folylpolyglutamate synthase/dihydrofolate synthase [Candidatus Cyrtobacter comes]|nr:folylpolyglutamate synthase/dihydrofolate synthase family protein [Candidatus Cyrtobacter comes]
MAEILERIGNPHKKLPPVIHVAGTNGKGSTVAFLSSILRCASYKIHSYTSPHLIRFNERIVLAGHEVEDHILYKAIEKCRLACHDMDVTFFEGTTAVAFLLFSTIEADILILETGLGGRLDATNIIESPMASVITPISMDHMQYLGETIEQIAFEKAGIIKNNLCVMSWQLDVVKNLLRDKCLKLGVKAISMGEDYDFQLTSDGDLYFSDSNSVLNVGKPSLLGVHQYINASTAVATIKSLNLQIDDASIRNGIESARWDGRMQKISTGPLSLILAQNSELWLDGAHNIHGIQMLSVNIAELNKKEKKDTYLIYGSITGKEIGAFVECLYGKICAAFTVKIPSSPISDDSRRLRDIFISHGIESEAFDEINDIFELCARISAQKSIRVIVCGSLYLVGYVLSLNK